MCNALPDSIFSFCGVNNLFFLFARVTASLRWCWGINPLHPHKTGFCACISPSALNSSHFHPYEDADTQRWGGYSAPYQSGKGQPACAQSRHSDWNPVISIFMPIRCSTWRWTNKITGWFYQFVIGTDASKASIGVCPAGKDFRDSHTWYKPAQSSTIDGGYNKVQATSLIRSPHDKRITVAVSLWAWFYTVFLRIALDQASFVPWGFGLDRRRSVRWFCLIVATDQDRRSGAESLLNLSILASYFKLQDINNKIHN